MKTFGKICVAVAMAAISSGAAKAEGDVKTVKFGKTGNWEVSALYKNGRFITCSGSAQYKSGISLSILAYSDGMWRIQFYKQTWPNRPVSTFPAKLEIDGRIIVDGEGEFRGRSVFIDLGRSTQNRNAVMYGQILAVHSGSGVSRFQLTGTMNAGRMVANCHDQHTAQAGNNNEGAFNAPPTGNNESAPPAANNDGAFGSPAPAANAEPPPAANNAPPAQPPKVNVKLTREATLDYAKRYLSKARMGFEILPSGQGTFRHFPVNWRYQNGNVGGMMVLRNAKLSADAAIATLLSDQSKNCQGQSATRRQPTTGKQGRQVARATGVCQENGQVVRLTYYAVEMANAELALIVEYAAQPAQPSAPGAKTAKPKTKQLAPNEA